MGSIKVNPRSKNIKPTTIELVKPDYNALVQQLSTHSKLNKNRLRITSINGKLINKNEELLDQTEVYVKDIGPQIGWRTVYLIEYFGPILVHYFIYNYLAQNPISYKLIYQMNLIHYGKREIENVLVHKFSNSTMPLFNLFKNSFHYWVLGGSLSLMYLDLGNLSIPQLEKYLNPDYIFYIWVGAEFFNAVTHIQLRLLGDKTVRKGLPRTPPSGGFFEIFISPNYTMEIYGWICVFLLNPNIFTLIFLAVGATQMYFWSIKKQQKYGTKKSFLIPFIF
ncbi:Trans-2,3-enoyl-CoA reductase [Wickerhamomyces ciferrii]|uniref:Trans-2,3-enoyl-CoA reductase n=1 Tax=Wickerhamomyces ciferrii (strain ATCC 14091 / BCRC 22168 / CBS 111 / JCM 3599 / NBRC 0793 / NRRL Y-1031 F-60-10) TaxID=1206466 RepID=K0KSJ1_WICCF|nr:Trans-2,3-enoyl-CoA reductase [Wickerhamomyces ciferrii]CCH45012.1 Trans-2,3-enoyl-CoA reductase [Wickerhamomyces ciferrii]